MEIDVEMNTPLLQEISAVRILMTRFILMS